MDLRPWGALRRYRGGPTIVFSCHALVMSMIDKACIGAKWLVRARPAGIEPATIGLEDVPTHRALGLLRALMVASAASVAAGDAAREPRFAPRLIPRQPPD